jgi:hypothetical protein
VDRLSRALALPDAELERLAPLLEAHAKRFDITPHVEALEHFYDRVFQQLSATSRNAVQSRHDVFTQPRLELPV